MRTHSDVRPYKCDICEQHFKFNYDIQMHKRLTCDQCHSTEEAGCKCNMQLLQCSLCSETFKSKSRLRVHIWKCQMEPETILETYNISFNGETRFQCPVCKLILRSKYSLKNHVRIHTKEKLFICEECGKQFVTSSALRRHKKAVHLKIKDHSCDVCGKVFSCPTNLTVHKRVHTGEKPFVCESCGKSFSQHSSLFIHKMIHTQRQYRYECSHCQKKFFRNSKLTSHLKTHSDLRPYECDICNASFKTNYERKKHRIYVHSETRPYQCNLCNASFKRPGHLKQHGKTHNTEKYTCLVVSL
ncbi:hypothetical protein M8J77_021303 [Diaphorina citri]|nr:hypothetical protein M8J77_021303 [Diaphorina citri]